MSPGSEHSNNRWYREFRPRFLEDRDPVETESINRQDDIEPWQDEDDWLCTVEFLPSDDLPGRVFAGDIVGYLLGYAQLANARTLAIVGDPEAGAYELLFSCLPELNKRLHLAWTSINEHPNHAELRINLRQVIGSQWTQRFWNKR